jgi:hypothetical protein
MLALEVIGALGDKGLHVGEQPRVLANRAALLGVGDPSTVLSAIATSEGTKLAASGPSRFRWVEAHPEAKDLLLFATTDRFAHARQQIGLAEASSPRPGAPPAPARGGAPTLGDRTSSAAHPAPPQRTGAPAPPRRPKPPPPKR